MHKLHSSPLGLELFFFLFRVSSFFMGFGFRVDLWDEGVGFRLIDGLKSLVCAVLQASGCNSFAVVAD